MFCTDCGNTRFVEYESDVTCTHCGLVAQSYCIYLADYGQTTFSDREPPLKRRKDNDIFDFLEFPLGLTEEAIATAKGILEECKYKGEGRRQAFIAAAIFYVTTKSITEIADIMGIPPKGVHKASTEIFETTVKYADVVYNRTRVESQVLSRLLQKLFFLPTGYETKLKCAVFKIQDKLANSDVLKPFKEDKVLATMIYMACENLGIAEGTMKNVALACGAAVPTLKNIYKAILKN